MYALGLGDSLVARTHECDYPPDAIKVPSVTESVVDSATLSSAEIDEAIRRALNNLSTIYLLDRERLASLHPDLILTQELCDVCAVSFEEVRRATREVCPGADILSLEPQTLADILNTIQTVGGRAGVIEQANRVIDGLEQRIERVRSLASAAATRPRVLALEWLDPFFTAGHWVPEMIEIAGGDDVLGKSGEPSRRVERQEVGDVAADVVVLMPCGFDLERCRREAQVAPSTLPALSGDVDQGTEVFAVDGSAYFNRPGPRVVDGLETLAQLLHPELFGSPAANRTVRVAVPMS